MTQEETQNPPQVVTIAIFLLIFCNTLNDFRRIGEVGIWEHFSHPIALAIVWVPVLWVANATRRGKNWGRVVIAGFTIFGLCYMPWSFPPVAGTKMALLQVTQAALYVTTSILLFRPAANRWFRSKKYIHITESLGSKKGPTP
jgi:hypothetical protein